MTIRTYSELIQNHDFDARYDYLKLGGGVGIATFGFDRYMNQAFYHSAQWRRIREHVVLRDEGCDLGVPGREIFVGVLIHHINPMDSVDLVEHQEWILDPEFLITTSHNTHNAIHYGNRSMLKSPPVERRPGDTQLWSSTRR